MEGPNHALLILATLLSYLVLEINEKSKGIRYTADINGS